MRYIISVIFIFSNILYSTNAASCVLKEFPAGYVCVCNATYCDSYEDIVAPEQNHYILTSSSQGGLRFNVEKGISHLNQQNYIKVDDYSTADTNETATPFTAEIHIRPKETYQKVVGFGGAFTGAVSYNLKKLVDPLRRFLYTSYYSDTVGIGYSLMRYTIGGCDFDVTAWSYAEEPAGSLDGFTSLNEEDLTKIQQIRTLEKETGNYNIKKTGCAWTSPKWMKNVPIWNHINHMQPRYYQMWAEYYLRWLRLMREQNFEFWAISTGNEPGDAIFRNYTIPELGFTAFNQGRFVGENLGPLIRSSEFSHLNLIGLEDERPLSKFWFEEMDRGYKNATDYIDALGLHWYSDSVAPPTFLDDFHRRYPNKSIYYTESCIIASPSLGNWKNAEIYFEDFSQNFLHYIQSWTDWNLILDLQGGPNVVNNFVDAAIIADTETGTEFYKQPFYYAIGHYSKFLIPDTVRIHSESLNKHVFATAFKRPDNRIVIIFNNNANQPAIVKINVDGDRAFKVNIPARSMHSLMYL